MPGSIHSPGASQGPRRRGGPLVKRFVFAFGAMLSVMVGSLAAQSQMNPKWERPGFDFSPDGVWRAKARRIRAARAQMMAQGNFAALNAARMSPARSTLVLTDTLLVPALLMRFKNTDTTILPFMGDTARYTSVLFASSPPLGRPYTIRTFYEQMTNNAFSMHGRVIGWTHLDSNEVFYTDDDACGGPCNGLNSKHAVMRMQTALRETLAKLDATVDFGLFDNDGPD